MNTSVPHICTFFFVVGMFKFCYFSNLQLYTTVLSNIVNIFYTESSTPVYLTAESRYPFATFSYYPAQLLATIFILFL